MSERERNNQLDLLGGVAAAAPSPSPKAPELVRWCKAGDAGKVGRASTSAPMSALHEARASVVLIVGGDPGARIEAAREVGIDLRHLELVDGRPSEAHLERQVEALASDVRSGRRSLVVAADDALAARIVASALVELGASALEAAAALGGQSALGPAEDEALKRFAASRTRAADAPTAEATKVSEPAPQAQSAREAQPELDSETAPGARAAAEAAAEARFAVGPETAPDARVSEAASETAPASGEDPAPAASPPASSLPGAAAPAPDSASGSVFDFELGPASAPASDVSTPRTLEAERAPSRPAVMADTPSGARPPLVDLAAIARDPRQSRLVGAVLGGAIGDAMGHPTEFIGSFSAIRAKWPPNGVEGYELWRETAGKRFAPYTDDTQMAECVLRALLWAREEGADLDATMRHLATLFIEWSTSPQGGHRAPGNACLAGCRSLARGTHWSEAGGATAGGCGSVMRAYPFGLVFARDLDRAEAYAVAHSKLTHRDPIALAASAAMAIGVARILRDDSVDMVLSEMVAAACRYSPRTAAMMARAIDEAQSDVAPETTLERLQGWAAHEAIAAAVYLFARHPDDPRAAILEGANTPGDSDSLATLAGAMVGARRGLAALPSAWVADVERVEDLTALALRI